MRENDNGISAGRSSKRILQRLADLKRPRLIWFILLLLVYSATMVAVMKTSGSEGVIMICAHPVPLRSLTGAFSSISNLCIIFLVVFFKLPGMVISLILISLQFPKLLYDLLGANNYSSIAGLFSNILIILAICLLYRNNRRIEKYQHRLRDQAITDRLTGLANRFACSELMDDLISRGETFAVAVLNLNNFKGINNTMGQATGNAVLIEVADRLRIAVENDQSETHDFVTRQGGDEFAVIIRGFRSGDEISRSVAYYQKIVEEKITVDDCDYYLTARIGYAEYPADAAGGDELLACALMAQYEAKRTGSSVSRYTADLMNPEHEMEIERMIRTALEHGELFFYLQPQYDISHNLRGFEVLARMKDEDGSFISPAEFIPVAEKVGLIDKVDHTVFMQSTMFFGHLIRKAPSNAILCINVSVRHLMKNDFLEEVRDVLEKSGVPAAQLEIEITESIMIDSIEKAVQCIQDLRSMGIHIAIDDFGTGYSSLSYLSSFPANLLKVDKSFIDQMNTNEDSRKYVESIISIGHVMHFDVIAEGVEEQDQVETLRRIGCDYIQGFIWGRPMPPEEAAKLIS